MQRTGPFGRLVRSVWAIVVAISMLSILGPEGPARFRNPHILTEPSAWLLHGLMVIVFVVLVGALSGERAAGRARLTALIVLGILAVIAAAIGQLSSGSLWGFPLADGVWIFDMAMLVIELVAFVLVIVVGLPGCELGVWPWLVARFRGEDSRATTGLACVVGLDQIDRWEAKRHRAAQV